MKSSNVPPQPTRLLCDFKPFDPNSHGGEILPPNPTGPTVCEIQHPGPLIRGMEVPPRVYQVASIVPPEPSSCAGESLPPGPYLEQVPIGQRCKAVEWGPNPPSAPTALNDVPPLPASPVEPGPTPPGGKRASEVPAITFCSANVPPDPFRASYEPEPWPPGAQGIASEQDPPDPLTLAGDPPIVPPIPHKLEQSPPGPFRAAEQNPPQPFITEQIPPGGEFKPPGYYQAA